MKRLRYELDRFFFFDIETSRKHDDLPEEDLVDYRYLRRNDLEKDANYETVNEDYKENGHKYDRYNMIICITIGASHKNKYIVKLLKGSQKEIIDRFYDAVSKVSGKLPAGHNISSFDIPLIRKKALEEGYTLLDIPNMVNDVFKKPWDITDNAMDTMAIFKGSGFINTSLEDVCHILGIEVPVTGVRGADVPQMYWDGKLDEIHEYALQDAVLPAKIVCKVLGLEFPKEIVYVEDNKVGDEEKIEEEVELNILLDVHTNNSVSRVVYDELKKRLKENKPLKYDWENLEKMLYAAMVNNDFINMNQDNKATKESKQEEAKTIIKNLKAELDVK